MNEKLQITLSTGEKVEAKAPVIISASRSTDIPAFYAGWFIERLRAGYVVWHNPFNRQKMYISFKNCKVVVFWTKNPEPLIPCLKELDRRGIHYYFQFSLNDYEKEGFEPNLPGLEKRIETFKQLSGRTGREKVIWRFDPLIVTPQLTPEKLLERILHTGNRIKGFTDKLVFSFIDIQAYRKVKANLVRETQHFTGGTIEHAEFTAGQMIEIAEGLAECRDTWAKGGWRISLATCAERISLEQYGIEHNRCIDGELMKRIFADDKDLLHYLSYGKLPEKNLFDGQDLPALPPEKLKDKGQRKLCGCMAGKDIGMYNTCRHCCVYCYAGTARTPAMKRDDS
jgi:hypothetical protein